MYFIVEVSPPAIINYHVYIVEVSPPAIINYHVCIVEVSPPNSKKKLRNFIKTILQIIVFSEKWFKMKDICGVGDLCAYERNGEFKSNLKTNHRC